MTYVMSDLHGMLYPYFEMLESINFDSDDKLFILGDICDRGDYSAELYLDIMNRDNVFCIKGNHEQMLLETLPSFFGKLRNLANPDDLDDQNTELWNLNGGDSTKVSFFRLNDIDKCKSIYEFIKEMPYFRKVELNGKQYTLVHAGGYNDDGKRNFDEFTPFELLWDAPDYDAIFCDKDSDVLIVGHTPTFLFREDRRSKIYFGKENIIDIDCGAVFYDEGGCLGCLRLDDMKEFYVDTRNDFGKLHQIVLDNIRSVEETLRENDDFSSVNT